MAGATGLEPAASCVTGRRSNLSEAAQAGVLPLNYSRSTSLDYHSTLSKTTFGTCFEGLAVASADEGPGSVNLEAGCLWLSVRIQAT